MLCCFFFNDPATTEIYTLSLHDALPICINVALVFDLATGTPNTARLARTPLIETFKTYSCLCTAWSSMATCLGWRDPNSWSTCFRKVVGVPAITKEVLSARTNVAQVYGLNQRVPLLQTMKFLSWLKRPSTPQVDR